MEIAFNPSPRRTLGVEMELMLVGSDTGALVSGATPLLAELGRGHPGGEHPKVKHELFECTVEVITGVCESVADARADLAASLDEVRAVAGPRGLALASAGSHPFSPWHDQVVSPSPRYAALLEEMRWVGERLQIFGVHVHVGVASGEHAVATANALTLQLPVLLALSSSSPYWEAHDTGLASARSKVFESLPTAGLPPHLDDWHDFERFMHTLVHAKAIRTIREVWWDVRPHPDFGTVELRMCDATSTLRETTAIAALAQCLVERCDRQLRAGEPLPVPSEWVMRQNKWLAARHGLDAELIVDETGARRPVRELAADLAHDLAPIAADLGCSDELAGVDAVLASGSSATRQRAVHAARGSLTAVVDALVAELLTDEPVMA